ncbi:hypothetical protein BDU57DRAFT_464396 [Ampelomyces quisqualis]|uniref:Copper acquisition factor BIM1-like domain-containing protein n=1 Tax=Ampelomyces quisqualis TaxID=50730 RepID=A0A6A5QZB2_AMPQU|nr:hypothetical protein BDU57DRAFT_464396 [Ampelomyces quisqualis]
MRSQFCSLLSILLTSLHHAFAQTHGEGAEGSEMGPVAFMWPSDRIWDAVHDNTGPCGSAEPPSNRTIFPVQQGQVALSIADDAYFVAFRIAVGNNPTSQSDFSEQVVANTTDIDPGHQCYKLDALENVSAGQNATIQLEYWAEFEGENDGKNQSFFACADITLVETRDFTIQVPCFNVTSEDFNAPTPSSSPGLVASPSSASSTGGQSGGGSSGLSTGAKAGIAVGAIVGGMALFGAIGFFFWRRGRHAGLKGKDEYELRAKNLGSVDGETAAK